MMSEGLLPEGRHQEIGDGLKVHYHEAGAGDAVVFIHGSGPGVSGYSNFKDNYEAVARAGYRAIVPDSLGFGRSSKPLSAEYSLSFLTGGLTRFIAALGLRRVSLVGNSLGGAMALKVALEEPDLVERLVLMAPGGLETRDTYMKMDGIRAMVETVFGRNGVTEGGLRRLLGMQLFDAGQLSEETVAERLEVALAQPARVFETLRVPNLSDRLGEVACPTLVFWGINDRFCPVRGAMRVMEACRDARAVLLSRCGHWVMVRDSAPRTTARSAQTRS